VSVDPSFGDFTEESYCAVLELARAYWRFESFGTSVAEPHVLWRHDVDVSPNRALRLAEIESERGLRATYFFLLHSSFYSCFEAATRDMMRRVATLGHDIGLHFDVSFYPEIDDVDSLEQRIEFEAEIISALATKQTTAVSFDSPTPEQLTSFDQPELAGLVNTYGHTLRNNYRYISDSNGYWRFDRLHDVLVERKDRTLHVLTHPEWWTPEPRSPRDRIGRAVEGRAAGCLIAYDAFLDARGRLNVR